MQKRKMVYAYALTTLLLFLVASATFAWFFINKEVEVDYKSEIICEAGTSLEISMLESRNEASGEELWSQYSGYVKYEATSAKIEDISGNGKELYSPTSIITNPNTGKLEPEGMVEAVKTDKDGYGQYLEVEIKLRSTSAMNVYLSGNSSVIPTNTSDTDRNAFGDFSRHYISGAVRVAILEVDEKGNEELKMIWAPNPNIELQYDKKTGKYKLEKNGVIEEYSYYKKNPTTDKIEKYYVTADEYVEKSFVLGTTSTTESMVNNSPILTTLSPSLGDDLIEQKLIIRVWFEGTDREADQALGGGQVIMNLKFIGMSEKLAPTDEMMQKVDNISIEKQDDGSYIYRNLTEDIMFSVNGYEWIQYSSTNLTVIKNYIKDLKSDGKVYFKVPETETHYEYINHIVITYEEETSDEN